MPPELLSRQSGQAPEMIGPAYSMQWLRGLRASGLALALGLLATAGSAAAQSVQVVVSGPVVHAPPPPRVVVAPAPTVVVRPAPRVVVAPPPS